MPAATAAPATSGLKVGVPGGIRVFVAGMDVSVKVGSTLEVGQGISAVRKPVWAVPHPARNTSNHIACLRIEIIVPLHVPPTNFHQLDRSPEKKALAAIPGD
jgi:hypothetical protein